MPEYTVILIPDPELPGAINVTVPALPGCLTYGDSREEALTNAREAIEVYLETWAEDGKLPPPDAEVETVRLAISVP